MKLQFPKGHNDKGRSRDGWVCGSGSRSHPGVPERKCQLPHFPTLHLLRMGTVEIDMGFIFLKNDPPDVEAQPFFFCLEWQVQWDAALRMGPESKAEECLTFISALSLLSPLKPFHPRSPFSS